MKPDSLDYISAEKKIDLIESNVEAYFNDYEMFQTSCSEIAKELQSKFANQGKFSICVAPRINIENAPEEMINQQILELTRAGRYFVEITIKFSPELSNLKFPEEVFRYIRSRFNNSCVRIARIEEPVPKKKKLGRRKSKLFEMRILASIKRDS